MYRLIKIIFDLKSVNSKALMKSSLYILLFSFFVFYIVYFSQFTELIFGATVANVNVILSIRINPFAGTSTIPAGTPAGSISIYKGWNLISFPYSGSAGLVGTCQSSVLTYYNWDMSTAKWKKYSNTPPAGSGFWVYSSIDCIMQYTTGGSITSIALQKGWNQIGSFSVERNVADVMDGCTIVQGPFYYNVQTSSWDPSSTKLTPQKGYWVKTDNSCSFS